MSTLKLRLLVYLQLLIIGALILAAITVAYSNLSAADPGITTTTTTTTTTVAPLTTDPPEWWGELEPPEPEPPYDDPPLTPKG